MFNAQSNTNGRTLFRQLNEAESLLVHSEITGLMGFYYILPIKGNY